MLPVCLIYLILRYWVDKYQILKYFRAPPRYEGNIFDIQMILMRIAILFHLGFSLWIYTDQTTFPTKIYYTNDGYGFVIDDKIYNRIFSKNGIPFLVLLIFGILIFVFEYIFVKISCILIKRMRRFKINDVEKKAPEFSTIESKLAIYGNNTYDPFEHPMY